MNNSIYQRFPVHLSLGATGGPVYSTNVITTTCGKEQRNVNWQSPRNQYEISQPIKNIKDLNIINVFFRLHLGMAKPFRFRDWSDYKVTNQLIAHTLENQTKYQLIKIYEFEKSIKTRVIRKPVLKTLKVTIGGKPVAFEVDIDSGIIDLKHPQHKNLEIRATFEFDVLVRFNSDELKISSLRSNESYANITFIEVKE